MSGLDDLLNYPYDDETDTGVFTHIAKVRFSFAYKGGSRDSQKIFPFQPDDKRINMQEAKSQCQEYMNYYHIKGTPQLGIYFEIPLDTFLTAHEKMTWDPNQFVNSFHSEKEQADRLTLAEKERIEGKKLPYDRTIETLAPLGKHFGQWVWVEMAQETNWYHEAKEWRRSEEYPDRIYVINRVITEKEAYAAANKNTNATITDDLAAHFSGAEDGLSEYASQNRWTLVGLQEVSQQIHDFIADAMKGENTPDKKPMNMKQARSFACEQYAIELTDLKLLKEEIPF